MMVRLKSCVELWCVVSAISNIAYHSNYHGEIEQT